MSANAAVRRQEDADRAYDIQMTAGLKMGGRATAGGIGLAIIAHYAWPAFRRQTLPFKAFLVCGFAVSGVVFGAEGALLEYESVRRAEENNVRRQARIELGRQGIIPTESEIARWRSAKEQADLRNA
ncbi:hypothetical protein CYLTODRAFT_387780 [Cylindrobasidium torrendii FP15055 ss-10]|uniref:HIG1 domain-containing protein n=1 Tax=Cylindrobasidium torrendii FP15055 ss-10 TaxID=1314674 RepID=A0A0D7BRY8_9AGAR|nr:hypothetical protein CYLTODRAFT_387780 [Cylindrobasidium torrendii FP15055 ss-10]